MSGIAGIFNRDGRPVEPELLSRMTDCIAHRGPDGINHWLAGPVGLGHAMLWTTPESLNERQPLLDETGQLCLVLDGRVDNRQELITALAANGFRLGTDTDAELVLRAYQCWGEACPEKIIGDFAFVIWDGHEQRLFCARDALGIRPFYYFTNRRVFLFGSELHQLFEHPAVNHEPNEGMLAEFLADAITSLSETFYRNIFRLPPAHCLIVQPGKVHKKQYWDIESVKRIYYRTDADYAENFFQLFKEAVGCRLRSFGSVGADLSGGLDSSSVVAMAQILYQKDAIDQTGFESFSLVFPGLKCDESNYIQKIIHRYKIPSNTLLPQIVPLSHYLNELQRYQDFPGYPNGAMMESFYRLVRTKGCHVILTGLGGDEWFSGARYFYSDLLQRLRLRSLVRQVNYDYQYGGAAFCFNRILRFGLWPLVPQTGRRLIRRGMGRPELPYWLEPAFARRTQLLERITIRHGKTKQFSSIAQRELYNTLTSGWQIHAHEMRDRSYARFGIEGRHPFQDRRIVEFALNLPEDQRQRQAFTKFVVRQAMVDILPNEIRQRLDKANMSHIFVESLQDPNVQNVLASLQLEELGWLQVNQGHHMLKNLKQVYQASTNTPHIWALWMIVGIELWVRKFYLSLKDNMFDPQNISIT